MKIIIIDNYDSFTYNLYQYIAELTGVRPEIFFNDKLSIKKFATYKPDAVILSPGPGDARLTKDFGICREIILQSSVPVLGVCLGHQGIGSLFGAKLTHASQITHGRTSKIYHNGLGLFRILPQGFEAMRYHSLIVSEENFPESLIKTAWTHSGTIMGIQHKTRPLFGVQFHPESIATPDGKQILKNFFEQVIL